MSDDLTKKIVICDIDGTIANNDHRQHLLEGFKDWDKFFEQMYLDAPIFPAINLIKKMQAESNDIVFLTGRPERYRGLTEEWLLNYFKFEYKLLMRSDDDLRNKTLIKEGLFKENITPNNVLLVLENDKDLINLWISLGLETLDVEKVIA